MVKIKTMPGKITYESDLEEQPNEYREAARRMMEFSDRRDQFICSFRGNRMLAYCCTLLAMEKREILGCDDGERLAQQFGVSREAVHQIVRRFKRTMEL